MKSADALKFSLLLQVAPVRERGLKYQLAFSVINTIKVAPVRERGLKLLHTDTAAHVTRRSRKGAWIEMPS